MKEQPYQRPIVEVLDELGYITAVGMAPKGGEAGEYYSPKIVLTVSDSDPPRVVQLCGKGMIEKLLDVCSAVLQTTPADNKGG